VQFTLLLHYIGGGVQTSTNISRVQAQSQVSNGDVSNRRADFCGYHKQIMTGKVALGQAFPPKFQLPTGSYHSTNTPYSSIRGWLQ
jgi:hypothetical protein